MVHEQRSPHARSRCPRSSPRPGAGPDERRLRGAGRLRPAPPVPPGARQAGHGTSRPRRAARLRQQQHQVPDRRRDRRVDQGQAVPVRAVHPHRRAGPVGFRLGRRAPPDVLPVAQAGELHRLLHHDARRRPARVRAHGEAGRRDQGPPGAGGHRERARRRRLRRGPHLLRAASSAHRHQGRPAGDAGRQADQVERRDRPAVHRRRHGRRHLRRHRRGAQARSAGERDRRAGEQAPVRDGLGRRSSRSTRSPASGATRTRTTSPTA